MQESIAIYSPQRAEAARQINRLIMLVFVLMIFDGSLRKWVLPSLSTPLLMIKDGVVAIIYWKALRNRLFPNDFLARMAYIISGIFIVIAIIQLYQLALPYFPVIYGYRNYFFLMPLAFIMQQTLEWEDIKKYGRLVCLLAIPSAILVVIQSKSPDTAYINRSVGGEDQQMIFTVVAGVVRPYGFFSFTNGHAHFTALALAMVLSNFVLPRNERFVPTTLGLICLGAALANVAVSGSRTNFLLSALVGASLVGSGFFIGRSALGAKIVFFSMVGAIVGGVLVSMVFSENLGHMMDRQERAGKKEGGIMNRIIRDNFAVFQMAPRELPVLGVGLGVGSAAATKISNLQKLTVYTESEWLRIVIEAGLFFGFFYIIFRLGIALFLLYQAVKVLWIFKSPLMLVVLTSIFQTLVTGQMTFNNTACYFGWFTIGLCLAILKIFRESEAYPYQQSFQPPQPELA